jgi:hypothetical protein
MKKLLFTLSLLFLGASTLPAQFSLQDSAGPVNMIHVAYRPLLPIGSMGDHYGLMHSLGFEFSHKYTSNWVIDAGLNMIVDGEVKVTEAFDVLGELRLGSTGLIISDEGTPSVVRQRAEGFLFPVSVGKIFSKIGGSNPNNGLYVKLGAQYLHYRLRFEVQDNNRIQALRGDRRKAYDLLTTGIGLREEIGYLYMANNGYVNFSIGLDFSQNFTQNRRSFNALTGGPLPDTRVDLLAGLRFSWIFLIYQKAPGTYYY